MSAFSRERWLLSSACLIASRPRWTLTHLGWCRVADRDIFQPVLQVFEVSPHFSSTTPKAGYSSQPMALSVNTPAQAVKYGLPQGFDACWRWTHMLQHQFQNRYTGDYAWGGRLWVAHFQCHFLKWFQCLFDTFFDCQTLFSRRQNGPLDGLA